MSDVIDYEELGRRISLLIGHLERSLETEGNAEAAAGLADARAKIAASTTKDQSGRRSGHYRVHKMTTDKAALLKKDEAND